MIPIPKNWRYRLEYIGFRLAGALFAALPVEIASAVSGALWRGFGPLTSRHRRTLRHLARALPEKSDAERAAIAHDMWENLGRTFAEAFHLREIVDSTDRLRVDDEAMWRARADVEGGWIVCSAHFANWETAAGGLRRLGRRTASVYQKLSNPLVEAHVYSIREFLYPAGLMPKERSAALKMLQRARGGAALAILADLRDRKGLTVPFFGIPAPTLAFPAFAARSLGAPLFVAQLTREPHVRFRLHMVEIPVLRTNDRDADIAAATAALQSQLEQWIREAPGQWMWSHRRWG